MKPKKFFKSFLSTATHHIKPAASNLTSGHSSAFIFAVCSISSMGFLQGAIIWSNPITGTNPNTSNPYTTGQTFDSDLTVSGIGRGTGIIGTNANDRYNANSWNTGSLDTDAYFTFTLTPDSGFEIDFTSFAYTGSASGTGPTSFAFRSSLDSFATSIGSPTAGGTTIALSSPTYQNITSAIEFRLYGWGASAATGTFSINDFTFNGDVNTLLAAAPTYWDTNGAAGGVGGDGTWSSASTSFSTAIAGTDPSARAAVADPVIFDGTAGTVTVSGTVEADGGLTFNTNGYQITGGTAIDLGGATNNISAASGVTATIGTDLTGSTGMTKTGLGTLVFTGDKSYTGGTTISGGVLQLGDGSTNGSVSGAITNNATLAVNNGSAQSLSNDISGTGTFSKSGSGNLTLSGTNSYNGGTTVSAGTLTGTTSSLQGAITNNAAVVFDQATNGSYAGNMTGSGSFTKLGSGNVTLTGTNGYSGVTTVSSGTLALSGGSAIADNGAVSIESAGALRLDSSETIGSLSGQNGSTVNLQANTLSIAGNASTSYSGSITGTGILSKTGTGILTLDGNNNFSGGTNISAGTVVAAHDNALGTGAVAVTAGSIMATSGTEISNNISINPTITTGVLVAADGFENSLSLFTGSGTGNSFRTGNSPASNALPTNSPYSVEGSHALGVANGSYTITTGNIDTTGYVNLALSVRLASFSIGSTGNGADVGDSVILSVSPDGGNSFWTQAEVNGNGNAVWSYSGGLATASRTYAASDASAVGPASGGIRTTDGYSTIAISGLPTASNLQVRIATSNNSANELWTIDNFRLIGDQLVDTGVVLGSTSNGGQAEFSGNITLNSAVQLSAAEGGKVVFSGNLTDGVYGAKGITKIGDGTVELSGTNTFTGTTIVDSGTLVVGVAGIGSITSDVTVATGATLAGSGTITGNATINGTYAPGNSPGIQTISGNLTLGDVSISNFEIAGLSDGQFDRVNVGGVLTMDGTLNLVTTGSYQPGDFVQLFDAAGGISGLFSSITGTDIGGGLTWDTSSISSTGIITVIPEPSTFLLGGLGALALLRRRRR